MNRQSRFNAWYWMLVAGALKVDLKCSSVQFSSVAQSCLTLCDPMNRSTPGLPVYHQLPEFTQTHIHRVSDAIQPSRPLLSPSPPAPNLSQHQSLSQWVNSSHEVLKVLEFQLQHHSFQSNPRADLLQNGLTTHKKWWFCDMREVSAKAIVIITLQHISVSNQYYTMYVNYISIKLGKRNPWWSDKSINVNFFKRKRKALKLLMAL